MRIQIRWGVSLFIVLLAGCGRTSGQNGVSSVLAPDRKFSPVSLLFYPTDESENVPVNGEIEIWFSRPIDGNTVSTENFILAMSNGLHLPGKVTVQPYRASFRPLDSLKPGVLYHAELRKGVLDAAGLALDGEFRWSFRTSFKPSLPLKVSKLVPADFEISVSPEASVRIFFEDYLEKSLSPEQFIILKEKGGDFVEGQAESIGRELRFRPSAALALDGVYEATVLAGVPGEYGKKLQEPHSWSFSIQPSCSTLAAGNDCNQNGILDGQEFQQGTAKDCNGNCIPDECELPHIFRAVSDKKGPIGFGFPQNYTIENPPTTGGDVHIFLSGQGDFSTVLEYVEMTLNGVSLGDYFQESSDCSWVSRERVTLEKDFFNSLIDGSDAEFVASAVYTVDPLACGTENHVQWIVQYPLHDPAAVSDCNANGVPDSCEIDSDKNGIVDDCESLRDGGFESQELGFAPSAPWEIVEGGFHSVESFPSVTGSIKMPVEGKQHLRIASRGSFNATAPKPIGSQTQPPSQAAGISQTFRVFSTDGMLRFSAIFVTSEELGNSNYNDFLSVDLSDGTTTVNLLYLDTFSVFAFLDLTSGYPVTSLHTVEKELKSLFPKHNSETQFTLTALVGNVGDGAYESWGLLDGISIKSP